MNPGTLLAFALLAIAPLTLAAVLQPPAFNRPSGLVPTGFAFTLTNYNSPGAVMFTLDSVDPKNPDGTVYTNSRVAWRPITVNRTTTVNARVLSGRNWSDLVQATFVTSNDYTKLLITEVMYQPPGTNGTHERSREFLEIKNVGTETLDISGVSFNLFSFPTQTLIGPGEFKVLIRNTNAYLLDHPGGPISGAYPIPLQNGDSVINLLHASGAALFSMTYKTHGPWPSVPDDHNFTDKGFSLVTRDPNSIPNPHHFRSWRPSVFEGGSPGADDPPDTRPQIRLTEVLARPTPSGYPLEAIEIYNPYETNVDIGGWFLSDSRPQPKGYHIPANTIIPARSFLVFDSGDFGGTNETGNFALSSVGENACIFSATTNRNLTGYSDAFEFRGSEPGMSYGLVVNSVGDEFFVPLSRATIGTSNAPPMIGPVIINEINYHATSNAPLFVELMNVTDGWVPLFDIANPQYPWVVTVGSSFRFPQEIFIPPRAFFLVVSEDPEAFRSRFNVPAEVPIFGPISYYPDFVDYGVYLEKPSGVFIDFVTPAPRMIPIDSVNFERHYPWPAAANGSGSSLQRLLPNEFGNDPKNWRASAHMSPGRPNFTRPMEGWRAFHFSSAELADPAISADTADPDSDSLNNTVEYAFALNPKEPDRVPLQIQLLEGHLSAILTPSGVATDVHLFGESASTLNGPWSSSEVEFILGWPEIILRDRVPAASSRFLRINVSLLPP